MFSLGGARLPWIASMVGRGNCEGFGSGFGLSEAGGGAGVSPLSWPSAILPLHRFVGALADLLHLRSWELRGLIGRGWRLFARLGSLGGHRLGVISHCCSDSPPVCGLFGSAPSQAGGTVRPETHSVDPCRARE